MQYFIKPEYLDESKLVPTLRLMVIKEAFSQGRSLLNNGLVIPVHSDEVGFKAWVLVKINARFCVKMDHSTESWIIECSCKRRRICSHIVAVALAWKVERGENPGEFLTPEN